MGRLPRPIILKSLQLLEWTIGQIIQLSQHRKPNRIDMQSITYSWCPIDDPFGDVGRDG